MIIIAHRGLIWGPNDPQLENEPYHITQLLQSGWHVEVDVRREQDAWYLGHDHAQHQVDLSFLLQPHLWIHAKDSQSAHLLQAVWRTDSRINFFWHESDARVLTSQNYWWTQPGHELLAHSVAVMPETHVTDLKECVAWPCVAVCTDWGSQLR
jgi:hypothetical protein